MTLFPIIQPRAAAQRAAVLPLYREVEWDFARNTPVWRGGSPAIVTGAAAVLVWAWKALQTQRYRYEPYSRAYGSELEELIGQACSAALKKAEAARYVRECLLANPYITDVTNLTVDFNEDRLAVSCRLATQYGEVTVHAG